MKKHPLDGLVSKEVIKKLSEQNDLGDIRQLHEREVTFILLLISEKNLNQTASLTADVVDIALKHNATIFSIVGSFIALSLGWPNSGSEDNLTVCRQLGDELTRKLGSQICGLYGTTHGAYGNLCSATRLSFSYVLPEFDKLIRELATIPQGEIRNSQSY